MKKYLLLIVLLLVFTGIYAQTATEEKLRQSKDYLNNKLTYLLLQEFVKDSTKYQDTLQSISSGLQNTTVNNPLPYATLSSILKGKFDKVIIKLSDPVDKIDTKPLISQQNQKAAAALVDSAFTILNKSYPGKHQSLQENKKPLTDSIIAYLNQQRNINNDNNKIVDNTNIAEPASPFNYWIPVILIIILIIAAIGYSKFQSIDRKIKSIQNKSSTSKSISDKDFYDAPLRKSQPQKIDIDRLMDDSKIIDGFRKAIEQVQIRLSDIENMQDKPAVAKGVLSAPIDPLLSAGKQNVVDEEVFYMTLPINNYFLVKSKSLTKENTIYKFIVKPSKQEANFSVHISGSQLSDVLSVIESYIKPACDEENLPGSNVKNIITLSSGIAMLEGDKWIIKTKAFIRYE